MRFADVVQQLDPEIYRRLRRSLELGKWPDGRALTPDQQAVAMEAVIFYEQRNNIPETERVGYMESVCASRPKPAPDTDMPVRFVDPDTSH